MSNWENITPGSHADTSWVVMDSFILGEITLWDDCSIQVADPDLFDGVDIRVLIDMLTDAFEIAGSLFGEGWETQG